MKKIKILQKDDNKVDFANSKKEPANQQTNIQLNLFSWQTEQLAKGWKCLEEFNFVQSKKIFHTILHQDANDEEAAIALKIISYWKNIFDKCERLKTSDKINLLLTELESYTFPNAWGPNIFKDVILQNVITIVKNENIFLINNNTNLANLYLMANNPINAEKEILKYLETNKATANILILLANTQWTLSEFDEARQNYMEALLINSDEVQTDEIENKTLISVINEYGKEMAPAWGWIYKQLPLKIFSEKNEFIYSSKKGMYACYLLYKAEKARLQNDYKEKILFRKLLKENEPELYKAYFKLFNNNKL